MRAKSSQKLGDEKIVIPGGFHPFLMILIILAGGVAASTTVLFFVNELPVYALPVLGLVILMSALLVMTCLRYTRPTVLKLGPTALEIQGPEGEMNFPWGTIDSVQVVGATGCLADNPFKPIEKRIGLAVFLKGGPEGRNDVSQADAIICAGEMQQGERFMAATQSIMRAIKKRGKAPGRAAKGGTRIGSGRRGGLAASK